MKVLLVNNLEPADVSFNEPLLRNLSKLAEIDSVYYSSVPSADVLRKRYDAVVISGAPLHYSADTLQSRLPHMQWVRDTTVPILGICLGHQNIALLHGANMIVQEEAENGYMALDIKQDDPLFIDVLSGDQVAGLHSCSVSLPADFVLLASTERCRNQIMKHSNKPLYSMQCHAEHSATGITMLKNFIDLASRPTLLT
jgi:GMP synthase (glutamine-hydrolysing)